MCKYTNYKKDIVIMHLTVIFSLHANTKTTYIPSLTFYLKSSFETSNEVHVKVLVDCLYDIQNEDTFSPGFTIAPRLTSVYVNNLNEDSTSNSGLFQEFLRTSLYPDHT